MECGPLGPWSMVSEPKWHPLGVFNICLTLHMQASSSGQAVVVAQNLEVLACQQSVELHGLVLLASPNGGPEDRVLYDWQQHVSCLF